MNRDARAEAVAWLARLQASGRSSATERGLQKWLAASPEHQQEFERATDVWEELGGVPAAVLMRSASKRAAPARWPMWSAAVTAIAVFLVVSLLALRDDGLATRIGEQRMVTLSDGSRVTLNTDSRVSVAPWNGVREVRLDRGEALFEVAKDPVRPFVVIAGDKKVTAIGTAFVVRRQAEGAGERVSVTMVEGKVSVTDIKGAPATLVAGERMIVTASAPPRIDQPRVETVTAWRRGEVVLDGTSLADAIAEMNRYSPVPISTADESIAQLPVSGIFRAGDSESFATAVATLYGLGVEKERQGLVIARNARH